MAEYKVGSLARSCGTRQGQLFYHNRGNSGICLPVRRQLRPFDKPKKKKKKHVQPTRYWDQKVTEAIESSRPTVDEEIRLFIKNWKKREKYNSREVEQMSKADVIEI